MRRSPVDDKKVLVEFPFLNLIVGEHKLPNGHGWDVLLEHQPDMIHAILADIVKHGNAVPGKVGQRPVPKEENAPEAQYIIHGEANSEPLPISLPKMMKIRGLSERTLVNNLSISRRTLQRLLAGDYDPPLYVLEELSTSLNVHPSYWIEYRAKIVVSIVAEVFRRFPERLNSLFIQVVSDKEPEYQVKIATVEAAIERIHAIATQVGLQVRLRPKLQAKSR